MSLERKIYWILLGIVIAFTAALEFIPVLDGLMPTGTVTEFVTQYVVIIFTLIETYLALRLIKQNAIVRIVLLFVPALANAICYHLFMNSSFLYLLVMLLVAFVFVYPAKK